MPVIAFPDEWLAQSVEGLTPERLQELRGKAESGRTLWASVVAAKIATDAQIIEKLSHRFRLKVADTSKVDLTARDGVPEQLARRYHVLPLRNIRENVKEMYRAEKGIEKLLEGMGDREVTTLSDAPAPEELNISEA